MHRPMRGRIGNVHEERFVGRLGLMLGDKLGRVFTDRVGIEEVGARRNLGVVAGQQIGIVIAAGALNRTEESIEPSLAGPIEFYL